MFVLRSSLVNIYSCKSCWNWYSLNNDIT